MSERILINYIKFQQTILHFNLVLFLIILISILGAFFNQIAVNSNEDRMPVLNLGRDTETHFGFYDFSEVNNPLLSDIFSLQIKDLRHFFSIGDILLNISIFLGTPISIAQSIYVIAKRKSYTEWKKLKGEISRY